MKQTLTNKGRILALFLIAVSVSMFQSGCILISTAGAVATTAAKSTISIVGHTAETAVDVVVPDGDKDDD